MERGVYSSLYVEVASSSVPGIIRTCINLVDTGLIRTRRDLGIRRPHVPGHQTPIERQNLKV